MVFSRICDEIVGKLIGSLVTFFCAWCHGSSEYFVEFAVLLGEIDVVRNRQIARKFALAQHGFDVVAKWSSPCQHFKQDDAR